MYWQDWKRISAKSSLRSPNDPIGWGSELNCFFFFSNAEIVRLAKGLAVWWEWYVRSPLCVSHRLVIYSFMCKPFPTFPLPACDNLTEVANSSLRYNGAVPAYPFPKRGDTVTWVCETGYRQVGGATGRRVCADNGTWIINATDGEPPLCEGECGVLLIWNTHTQAG